MKLDAACLLEHQSYWIFNAGHLTIAGRVIHSRWESMYVNKVTGSAVESFDSTDEMCISFLFTNSGDYPNRYKLILINNRDEYYARATENAELKAINSELSTIYGSDLAGAVNGTWLGISVKDGTIRIGNLANVTGEDIHGRRGRGPIVTDFIKGNDSIENYNHNLFELSHEFSSFNFLSLEICSDDDIKIYYTSNTPKRLEKLSTGFMGMGNSPLSAPFKKVEAGIEKFKEILDIYKDKSKTELIEALMGVLKSEIRHYPDDELLERRKETAERFSSIHVNLSEEGYGTRTRTIILVDDANNVDYIEQTMTTTDPYCNWETTHLTLPNKKASPSAQL